MPPNKYKMLCFTAIPAFIRGNGKNFVPLSFVIAEIGWRDDEEIVDGSVEPTVTYTHTQLA